MQLRFLSQFKKNEAASQVVVADVSTIGIAGVKVPGSADYMRKVRSVTTQHFKQNNHPNIIEIQPGFNPFVQLSEQKRSEIVENCLVDAVKKLSEAGANFVIIPDDTLHNHIHDVRKRTPHVSVLGTGDVVPRACMQQRFATIGIMGDPLVMANTQYRAAFEYAGVKAILPDDEDKELLKDSLTVLAMTPVGTMHQQTLDDLTAIATRLKEKGCQAIVLASPKLSPFLNKETCGLPILDTTLILAEVAVKKAEFIQQEQMSSRMVNKLRAAL